MLTKDELKEALPSHLRSAVSDALVQKVNALAADPEEARVVRDNMVSYTSVLAEGRFKVEDYINAVVYVSHKLLGNSNQAAWKKTFPQRYQTLVARKASEKDISAYVAAYNKNKLVNLIMEQSLIPTWVLNADIYQKAINTQFDLMTDDTVSPKVRTEAANSLLTHLKRPETKKVELEIGARENSGMDELRGLMAQLAERQQALIAQGANTREIAHQSLRDITPVLIDQAPIGSV